MVFSRTTQVFAENCEFFSLCVFNAWLRVRDSSSNFLTVDGSKN